MTSFDKELRDKLAASAFDERFYSIFEQLRNRATDRKWKKDEIASILEETGLRFEYVKSERFFNHAEIVGNMRLEVGVNVRQSEVELLLNIYRGEEGTGGPFQLLAKQVADRRQPGFNFDPPYPWLPAASIDDMRLIARFAITVFNELKKAFSK
jgi:hypothetical protein